MLLALRAWFVVLGVLITSLITALGLSPGTAHAPAATLPAQVQATTTEDTPIPKATGTTPTTTTPTVVQEKKHPPLAVVNEVVRATIVNILCTTENGSPLRSISASGVIIDPRGVILTNAHVAQYFLLKDYPARDALTCVIRTGSPALPLYTAELVFISPLWIKANAEKIIDEIPMDTGEYDYAFLVITGVTGPSVVPPTTFPYLPIGTMAPREGDTTLMAGYPAGFLGGITVQKELYQSSTVARVTRLYTFDTDTVDLFSVGGTILSQHGTSGGAVADENGILIGLIATATDAPDTAGRDLRALTTEYINRDFEAEMGVSLADFLGGDIFAHIAAFNLDSAPALTRLLTDMLE